MNNTSQAQPALDALKRQQFVNLTTFRKSGAAVTTPVWFALVDGRLYGTSQPQTGKVKRIRNNPQVTVAPCTVSGKPLGEAFTGKARLLAAEEFRLADGALKRKYGLQYLLLVGMMKLRGAKEIFWEVTLE
jgi:PPOX class probable F420-dependent enzyme